MSLTIAGLAKSAGVGVETVRYYQRRGLLSEPERPLGSVRRYDVRDVQRLHFIRSAQRAGFTLQQIGELIDLEPATDRARAQAMARERIAALDQEIADLTASRAALEKLARNCARSGEGPCPILTAFDE